MLRVILPYESGEDVDDEMLKNENSNAETSINTDGTDLHRDELFGEENDAEECDEPANEDRYSSDVCTFNLAI